MLEPSYDFPSAYETFLLLFRFSVAAIANPSRCVVLLALLLCSLASVAMRCVRLEAKQARWPLVLVGTGKVLQFLHPSLHHAHHYMVTLPEREAGSPASS